MVNYDLKSGQQSPSPSAILAFHRELAIIYRLDPVIAQMYKWYNDHIQEARDERNQYRKNDDMREYRNGDIRVWTRMHKVMTGFVGELKDALHKDALGNDAMEYLLPDADQRCRDLSVGIRDWWPAATALLQASKNTVERAKLTPQAKGFAKTIDVTIRNYEAAKELQKAPLVVNRRESLLDISLQDTLLVSERGNLLDTSLFFN